MVDFFNHLTLYTNAAYIKGSVKFGDLTINSPLQGQSPYLVNSGLTYSTDGDDLSVNILYNRIGPSLRFRAINGAAKNIFEKPRDVMDLQIAKKMLNNKLEVSLTVSDIFAKAYAWYYKFDPNPSNYKYDPSTDRIITATNLALLLLWVSGLT